MSQPNTNAKSPPARKSARKSPVSSQVVPAQNLGSYRYGEISPERLRELEDLLLAKLAARDHLDKWIEYRQAGFVPAAHHQLIISELEKVERGETKRLMLMMPPGSAKSTYASVEFPAWYLGRNPTKSIIAVSHTIDLAERFGRKARNIVATPDFKGVFSVTLADDSQAAGKWEVMPGNGEYYAAGVGGNITGRRGDGGLIDDPVKSREAADSERQRESDWQWYLNDFLTRLKPDAWQILIMTRWHEDDLGGRILEREADKWRVIKLPMVAVDTDDPLGRKPGDRLWPGWFTDDMVQAAMMDTRSWNSLYQQNPVPDEGDYFRADWFGEYEAKSQPSDLEIYGASDYAVTDGRGDYTEHGIIGVDQNSNWYLLDWWFDQTNAEEWIESQCDLIVQHNPRIWFGEKGVIRQSTEPALMKRMNERRAHCQVEWLASTREKTARARPVQARASMGKIFFPKHAVWKSHVITQLLAFPAGKHDDSVDVLSLLGRGLEFIQDGGAPRRPKRHLELVSNGSWMG